MLFFACLVSFVLCITFGQTTTISGRKCEATKISKITFSYSSYRNQSGRRMTQVGLNHDDGGPLSSNKTSPWSLDVEQTTANSCEGQETINVVANIAGPPAPPGRKIIPADYSLFPNTGHYKVHPQGASWSSARQTCADEGAHLVIINSDDEVNVMKTLFTNTPKSAMSGHRKDAFWVGIVEKQGTKQYFTIFGETLDSAGFSRWSPGDPNNSGSDACIWLYEANLSLADISPCSTALPFVCEIEL